MGEVMWILKDLLPCTGRRFAHMLKYKLAWVQDIRGAYNFT